MQEREHIRARVQGRLSRVNGAGGEHAGFQITAAGITWEVDVSAEETLRTAAERLDGSLAVVEGTYAERRADSRTRRMLIARRLQPGSDAGRREYIDVEVHGTVQTGVLAIGGETTGATITAGTVAWDLELNDDQRKAAGHLSGSTAAVSGQLRLAPGVEIRSRYIVTVRTIAAP